MRILNKGEKILHRHLILRPFPVTSRVNFIKIQLIKNTFILSHTFSARCDTKIYQYNQTHMCKLLTLKAIPLKNTKPKPLLNVK